MKRFSSLAAPLLLLAISMVSAQELDSELTEMEADPRLFFVNFTSSLIQVNATLLAYGLLLLAFLELVLSPSITCTSSPKTLHPMMPMEAVTLNITTTTTPGNPEHLSYSQGHSGHYDLTHDFSFLLYTTLFFFEVYEKFDYNDLECQKRLICEVMKEPDYYGNAAQKFKNGFQYAKYLEVLNLPDDMRELLDEYMDANTRADQSKECSEFFDCPYSIKDSVKRNISGNDL
ncbi:Uncharacterized protein FKW44_005965 [Caligus rogercresseyi]|uniref:Uncharacterized protein n=1 Tax=Caligus rogercresseyi TaxID=217165 RepID=A0A7T8QSH8_CALRO|nr:Uncharacterized protein FKW44_005965 [Caligus rogercresseyi]